MDGKTIVDKWFLGCTQARFYTADMSKELITLIDAALAAEREACAKVAEDHVRAHDEMYPEDAIAAAIRERGKA